MRQFNLNVFLQAPQGGCQLDEQHNNNADQAKIDPAAQRHILSPLRGGGGNSCVTSPSDNSSEGMPQNGVAGSSVNCCSTSVQTDPNLMPQPVAQAPPVVPAPPPQPANTSPPNVIESLQRRASELEVENNAQRQTITLAHEHGVKSRQLIQDLLIEKVCAYARRECVFTRRSPLSIDRVHARARMCTPSSPLFVIFVVTLLPCVLQRRRSRFSQ